MPTRWSVGLALAALALSAHARSVPRANAVLTHCAAHAANLAGLSALRAACPGIGRALRQLHLADRLPGGWRRAITPADLGGLAKLAQRYAGTPARRLADAPLRDIARDLKPQRPPPDAWSRFMTWVHQRAGLLLRRARRWLDSFSHGGGHSSVALALIYGLATVLLLAIGMIVRMAWRSACRSRRPVSRAGSGGAPPGLAADGPDTGVRWAQLHHHPAAWLRVLVEALAVSRRLDVQRALTCRELALRARFDSDTQRADFQRIATLAERELYGPAEAHPAPEEAWRRAQTLQAELRRPPQPIEAERP